MLWMCLGEEDSAFSCVVQCLFWREQHGSLDDLDQNRERVRGGQGGTEFSLHQNEIVFCASSER